MVYFSTSKLSPSKSFLSLSLSSALSLPLTLAVKKFVGEGKRREPTTPGVYVSFPFLSPFVFTFFDHHYECRWIYARECIGRFHGIGLPFLLSFLWHSCKPEVMAEFLRLLAEHNPISFFRRQDIAVKRRGTLSRVSPFDPSASRCVPSHRVASRCVAFSLAFFCVFSPF